MMPSLPEDAGTFKKQCSIFSSAQKERYHCLGNAKFMKTKTIFQANRSEMAGLVNENKPCHLTDVRAMHAPDCINIRQM